MPNQHTKNPQSDRDRFLTKVNKTGSCWLWEAAAGTYGLFWRSCGDTVLAHRASYELFVGAIPRDLMVLHKCDNPLCVNPDHLYVGTAQNNADDRINRDRANAPSGEEHWQGKLNWELVNTIREDLVTPSQKLADSLGLTRQTVNDVRKFRTWVPRSVKAA